MRILAISLFIIVITSCEQQSSTPVTKASQSNAFVVFDLPVDGELFQHKQNFTADFLIHEPLGSGVAVIDIDNDGQYELFFAQFDDDESHSHASSVLYQKQAGKYQDITDSVGLSSLNHIMGAAVADINQDGWSDLLVYGYRAVHLMINHQGTFKKQPLPFLAADNFFTSATFFHANDDQWPDLWLSTYVQVKTDPQVACKSGDGQRMHCAPAALPFQKDRLFMNNAGQSFIEADDTTINIPSAPALGVVAADFNQDGLFDIYVANDGENNFLFTQQTDGRFVEQAQQKGVATNMAGLTEASMGIAVGDYDNDGLTDLFLTHIDGESNTLYNNKQDWFNDATNNAGLAANSRVLTGFGTGFYDLNGDNWLDIFVTNGRIQAKAYQNRDNLIAQFSEPALLYFNDQQGGFISDDNMADQAIIGVGRGTSFVDLDNDGDKDIIISNNNQAPIFLNNRNNPSQWIGLDFKCEQGSIIGTKLDFVLDNDQHFYRTVHTDGSYVSANDPRVIIALDDNKSLHSLSFKAHSKAQKDIDISQLTMNTYNTINCDS